MLYSLVWGWACQGYHTAKLRTLSKGCGLSYLYQSIAISSISMSMSIHLHLYLSVPSISISVTIYTHLVLGQHPTLWVNSDSRSHMQCQGLKFVICKEIAFSSVQYLWPCIYLFICWISGILNIVMCILSHPLWATSQKKGTSLGWWLWQWPSCGQWGRAIFGFLAQFLL